MIIIIIILIGIAVSFGATFFIARVLSFCKGPYSENEEDNKDDKK